MSALISANLLGGWRRIRQYAVPAEMIRAATEARLAGDWRGACAAAGVEPAPDDFTPFEDDLRHFAPDLLRWHLPRNPCRGDTTLTPRQAVRLARSGDSALYAGLPRLGFGPQRLRLFVSAGELDDDDFHGTVDFTARRELWDAREAPGLLRWTRGAPDLADRILALQDAGKPVEAWAAAGVDVPATSSGNDDEQWRKRYLEPAFTTLDADLSVLVEQARRRSAETGLERIGIKVGWYHELLLTGLDGKHPRGEWADHDYTETQEIPGRLEIAAFKRPIDMHLLRFGMLRPEQLHPLVFAAFFPERTPPEPPVTRQAPGPVRVRCNGHWHEVRMTAGRLDIPHSDAERQREHTLRALGGRLHGCFAAEQAWRDRSGRLPRRLEEQRRDLMLRAQHGDLAGVLALLDAGVDPQARDTHGRTLLHLLPGLDDLSLVPRLLAAGLDVDVRDARGYTPLHTAVHANGSPELVRALLAAGARPDTTDHVGESLADALHRHREGDLAFLAELLP
jgi:hypothetical protein